MSRRDVRRPPAGIRALVAHALGSGDAYAAAGVYAVADRRERRLLEHLMFDRRATALRLAPMDGLPPAVLGALARLGDEAVDRRLANQPRLPALTAMQLIQRRCVPVLVRLARNVALPPGTLKALSDSSEEPAVIGALCENVRLDGALINRLAMAADAGTLARLAGLPSAPVAVLRRAWRRAGLPGRLAVARHPRCPAALTRAAVRDRDAAVRRAVAAGEATDGASLAVLAGDSEWSVRRVAAAQAALPTEAVAALVLDPVAAVRRVVVCRGDLSRAQLRSMVGDADGWVRQGVARHSSSTSALLSALAADPDPDVRRAAARHPRCPAALLDRLAGDPDGWVRAAVAGHPRTARATRARLLATTDVDVLSAIALSAQTPQTTLQRLAHHPCTDIRRSVILNRSAGTRAVRSFVEDSYPLHRALVVAHPNLPPRGRWSMRLDPEPRIRLAVHAWFAVHLSGRSVH